MDDLDQQAVDDLTSPGGGESGGVSEAEFYGETGGGGEPSGGAPAAPPAPSSPTVPAGLEGLFQHLPQGLKNEVAAGRLDAASAIGRHYNGYAWNRFQSTERDLTAVRQQLAETSQRSQRFERLLLKMGKEIGVDTEERPPAPPDPAIDPDGHVIHRLSGLEERLDRVLSAEDERQLDGHIDQLERWSNSDRASVMRELPDFDGASSPTYAAAEAHVANAYLSRHRQLAEQDWTMQQWDRFPREYLEAVVSGQILPEQVLERVAIERAMADHARLQLQYNRSGGSLARHVLEAAYRLGFNPQGGGQQPQPAQPGDGRGSSRLDGVRTRLNNAPPAPMPADRSLRDVGGLTKEAIDGIAKMSPQEFDRFLSQCKNPEEVMSAIMRSSAVS